MATSADNSARLEYLWSIAHHVHSISPELSSFYSQRFLSLSDSLEVTLSENLLSQFCTKCGNLFVPGVTCKVQVKHNQKKKASSSFKTKRNLYNASQNKRVEKLFPLNFSNKTATAKTSNTTKNVVNYTCHKCHRISQFNGTDRTHLTTITPKTPTAYFERTSSELSTPTNLNSPLADKSTIQKRSLDSPTPKPTMNLSAGNSPTVSSAKKKKGKKLGLQKLISQSKEKEKKPLNLNDFLSSLN
ncbi:Rpr2-domain-containing protein [Basidiobolus meristosporus CBS 931.73]|uniref:Rpr2-domain-containing protein n=1 Tax=Basidiobolus meristosporus CBS 931.73 TaxID=1314790 RepID=A0A1Y1YNG8_9FUNG|nr:Rpr2-domain-containing protein [Basidiobolus meristosporus CBS 931.73]|eukprot:ORX99580.1 Rpr2-domain-containing protein [Basidiobolus meristosporus CBS 931.73]